jgi:hypothetical protein
VQSSRVGVSIEQHSHRVGLRRSISPKYLNNATRNVSGRKTKPKQKKTATYNEYWCFLLPPAFTAWQGNKTTKCTGLMLDTVVDPREKNPRNSADETHSKATQTKAKRRERVI